jgi:hypothetical protein
MNTTFPNQKPGLVTAIAVMTLTSGIINLFWGFVASATALGTIVGVICLPVTILPTILGIFEIIYAAKLLTAQPQPVQPSMPIAWFQVGTILYGNVFSMVAGILNLIFFNDQTVKAYFAQLNNVQVLTPAPVAEPVSQSAPEALPVPVESSLPEQPAIEETPVIESSDAPVIDEAPAKPKRTRKVAGK